MKHIRNLLLILVLGFMFIPNFVLAAEDIPREGVTYFLVYPDYSETAVDTYEEAMNMMENGEKLLYKGRTDENGKIPLEGWKNEGKLRILQRVPNGYSTDYEEIKVDLSKGEATFVNYRGVNPNTGRSVLLIVLIIASLVGITILLRSKNKKKALFVIIPAVLLGITLQVKAINPTIFTINVKDREGNKMANVEVLVYAKPIMIDPKPAIKYSANGGQFLDGEEVMYVRIPSSPCTRNQFYEYVEGLGKEVAREIYANIEYATKEGYVLDLDPDNPFEPEELTNGMTINLIWVPWEDGTKLVTLHGNGGYFPFRGKILTEVRTYNSLDYIFDLSERFVHDEKYFVGIDQTASCPDPYMGASASKRRNNTTGFPDDVYDCWEKEPDGLIVNGTFIPGNAEDCSYNMEYFDNEISIYGPNGYINFYNNPDGELYYTFFTEYRTAALDIFRVRGATPPTNQLIFYQGKNAIISINENEINEVEGFYYITNEQKETALKEFLNNYKASCYYDLDPVGDTH